MTLGDWGKPAAVLLERMSDLVGGYLKPRQIRRVTDAEVEADIHRAEGRVRVAQLDADAERIAAEAKVHADQLRDRALNRFVAQEARNQANMEAIAAKALPLIQESGRPQDIDEDWLWNFMDKSRLISNDEMQTLWGKLLAGEANSPGTFSRRTVNLLESLDKRDAELFTHLCGFCWAPKGDESDQRLIPLIFQDDSRAYYRGHIDFVSLSHLEAAGLVQIHGEGGIALGQLPKYVEMYYYGLTVRLELPKEADNELPLGNVLLTQSGIELAPICGSSPVNGFVEQVTQIWMGSGISVSVPLRPDNPSRGPTLDAGIAP